MACRSIRPVKNCCAYPNTSAYARICSCESRALRPGMNPRWMAIKRPALSSPGGYVQQGEGDRDVVRRRGAPCLTTDSRRVTGTAIRLGERDLEDPELVERSDTRIAHAQANPAVSSLLRACAQDLSGKWRALRSDAHRYGSKPSCFSLGNCLQVGGGHPGAAGRLVALVGDVGGRTSRCGAVVSLPPRRPYRQ